MKTSIVLTVICLGVFLSAPVSAQMHNDQSGEMPMNMKMMQDHMTLMAKMMSEMAEIMQGGKLTPEQQIQCATHMQRLSGLMHEMAADPKQEKAAQRQFDLQKTAKEWNYWKEKQQLYGH